jgi:hypothetical protein
MGRRFLALAVDATRRRVRRTLCFYHINDSRVDSSNASAPPTPSRRTWRIRQRSVYPQPILSPWHARSVAVAPAALLHAAVMLAAGAVFLSYLLPMRARNRLWLAPSSISE